MVSLLDLPDGFEKDVRDFIDAMPGHIDTYEGLLTGNIIWQKRIQGVGVISAEAAIDIGLSGPSLRGSGVDWDLRRDNPYSGYENYDFKVCVEQGCDTWARYRVRLNEMRESVKIIRQAVDRLQARSDHGRLPEDLSSAEERCRQYHRRFDSSVQDYQLMARNRKSAKSIRASRIPKERSVSILSPTVRVDPYRMKIRPASFVNLQALPQMVQGRLIADVVAIIGTLDIVLGEIDR